MTPALRINGLTFQRHNRLIIDNVDLTITTGTITALIGPNGAGKSTLLQLIAHLEAPSSGTLTLHDEDITAMSRRQRARRIAYIDQHSDTELTLSVHDVVSIGRTPLIGRFSAPGPEDRAAINTALRRVRAEHLALRRFSDLSGGERQRVLLARALAQEPVLLLLDEPTNHLDIRAQLETLALLQELSRDGLTVIAALHDVNLASAHADSVIAISDGRVIATGETTTTLTPELVSALYDVDATPLRHGIRSIFSIALPDHTDQSHNATLPRMSRADEPRM